MVAFWSELFDTHVHYTGVGSVYQFSGVIASGLTPAIAAGLLVLVNGTLRPCVGYMIVDAVISPVCVHMLSETHKCDLTVSGAGSR